MIARLFNAFRGRITFRLVRRWRYWKLKHLTGCRRVGVDVAVGKDVIIWTSGGLEIGDHVCIRSGVQIYEKAGAPLTIGNNVHLGHQCILDCMDGITIGDGTLIGYRAMLIDNDHRHDDPGEPIEQQGSKTAPITISRNVWLGANVVVLKGVTIGEGAVIGANAVVTKDVPPYTVMGGVPAREIKRRGSGEGQRKDEGAPEP